MAGNWMIAMALLLCAAGSLAAAEWVQESPGQKAYYDAGGQLERLEIDADRDGRFEIEERYVDRRRVKRREDLDGDGIWERQFTWEQDGSALLREDGRKGKIQVTHYEPGGAISRIEKDTDRDGRPDGIWEYSGGKLQRVSKPRGTWHYRDGRLIRAELLDKRNGRIERIEYYGTDSRIEKAEELTPAGKVRSRWFYSRQGRPLRVEEDLTGDGKMDSRREFRENGTVERLIDADQNGVTEIRELYAADGRFLSREEDLDGDGVFDLRTGRVKEN